MNNIINVPNRITGKSVENIAARLYDALTKAHPSTKEFRLEYLIFDNTISPHKKKERKLEADSKDAFIKAFLQYHSEGKSTIKEDISGEGDTLPICKPSQLEIRYRVNEQYCDQYYTMSKGIEKTNAFFSGFRYHRSKIKRFLVNNHLMKSLRTNVLSKYPRVESFLKNRLVNSNARVNKVVANPLYIRIEQKTKQMH